MYRSFQQNQNETKRFMRLALVAFLGAALAIVQVGYLLLTGHAICPTNGCKVVEELVKIPVLWFNIFGACFFLFLLMLSLKAQRSKISLLLFKTLALCGIAAEGVLVSYQIFIVHTYCIYCLALFGVLLLLNILLGLRYAFRATLVFSSVLLIFSLLQFSSTDTQMTLDHGTYAVKSCDSSSSKKMYFIFSESCPHCREVLTTLQQCNSCEVRFNPLQTIQSSILPDVKLLPGYEPEVNRNLLKSLGINTIPILIEQKQDGLVFIRGEGKIVKYIEENCFAALDSTKETSTIYDTIETGLAPPSEDGECSVEKSCEDDAPQPGKKLWEF